MTGLDVCSPEPSICAKPCCRQLRIDLTEKQTFQAVQFHLPRGGYTATWNISTKAPNPCEMPTISQRADHRSGVESLLEMNQFAE
jgi:hypothetical protein